MPTTRRQVALGLAWAVPTIAMISAAPALAASGCPTFSLTPAITAGGYDRWTLTNTGPGTWPAGTTISWTIQNKWLANDTFTIRAVSGLTPSTGTTALATNAQGTFAFTTTAAVAVGGTVSVTISSSSGWYTYYGQFNMTWPAPYATCPAAKRCGSDAYDRFGVTCPGGGATPLRAGATTATTTPTPAPQRPATA